MLGLARTLENEPLLISQMVRYRILNLAVSTLERRANAGRLGPREATNLLAAFERAGATSFLPRALIGERACDAPYFRLSQADAKRIYSPVKDNEAEADSMRPIPRNRPLALTLSGFYDLDFGQFLFAMEITIALASLPPPANLEADNHFARAGAAAKKRNRLLSSLILSTSTGSAASENESIAYLSMATTALALEQFRNQNGRLPESLDQLTPGFLAEVPEDPFTGMDLQYQRREKGYLLYSVGRDLQDDHGLEKSEKKKSSDGKSFDLTVIVER